MTVDLKLYLKEKLKPEACPGANTEKNSHIFLNFAMEVYLCVSKSFWESFPFDKSSLLTHLQK